MKVKLSSIIFVATIFSLISIVSPSMLWRYSTLATMMGYTRKLAFVMSIWLYFRMRLYKDIKTNAILAFFAAMIIQSYFVSGKMTIAFDNFMLNFSALVLVIYGLRNYPKKIIIFLALMLTAWIALNTLTWREGGAYITANGQYGFFLGTKTSVTYFQIFAFLFVDILFWTVKQDRKFVRILFFINLTSICAYYLLQDISTSFLCLCVYVILHYIANKPTAIQRNFLNKGFWIIVGLNFGIVFFNIQNLFQNFISNVLHEDITMNNRTAIWHVTLLRCMDSLAFGHGMDSDVKFAINEFTSYNTSAHNQLLNWLFLGGIVGLVYMLGLAAVALHINNGNPRSRISQAFRIAFVCLSLLWISEQYNTYVLYTIALGCCFHIDQLWDIENYEPMRLYKLTFHVKDM